MNFNINIDKINSFSLGYGELALKGKNRSMFEENIRNKIVQKLRGTGSKLYYDINKLFIEFKNGESENIFNLIKNVFGVNNLCLCVKLESEDEIKEKILEIANELYEKGARNFRVSVNRANKNFQKNSMEYAKELGAHILINTNFTNVKMKDSDVEINVDIRDKVYIYTEKRKMYGGLPLGSAGKGLSLISGGIDSPVSSFMMSKRGLKLHYVTFHSFPYTSLKALEKVKDLVKILTKYNGKSKLFSINILKFQEMISEKCSEQYATILTRRFMMRLSNKLAKENNLNALVTGESLGQVASQTLGGLNCTDNVSEIVVFRPLIGMDKIDIINISTEIETYDISILPYIDSCEMFAPKKPITNPKIEDIEKEELKIENYMDILEDIYNNEKDVIVIEE